MSTATNGAATEAAFKAITRATKDAGTAVVDATASVGAIGATASGLVDGIQGRLCAGRLQAAITGLSLDAYDASVQA